LLFACRAARDEVVVQVKGCGTARDGGVVQGLRVALWSRSKGPR
jgi:hypothetical protein